VSANLATLQGGTRTARTRSLDRRRLGAARAAAAAPEAPDGPAGETAPDGGGGHPVGAAHRRPLARPAGAVRALAHRRQPVLPVGRRRRVGAGAGRAPAAGGSGGGAGLAHPLRRRDGDPGAPARRRCPQRSPIPAGGGARRRGAGAQPRRVQHQAPPAGRGRRQADGAGGHGRPAPRADRLPAADGGRRRQASGARPAAGAPRAGGGRPWLHRPPDPGLLPAAGYPADDPPAAHRAPRAALRPRRVSGTEPGGEPPATAPRYNSWGVVGGMAGPPFYTTDAPATVAADGRASQR
jgi:hypothetical protein